MARRALAASFVLAALFASVHADAQYRVAVVSGGTASSTECAAQLADDTHFDFAATVVTPDEIDTPEELAVFDVVVWGDSGNDNVPFTLEMVAAVETWADEEGGGVVSTSWVPYSLEPGDPIDLALDGLTPIDCTTDPGDRYCEPPDVDTPLALDIVGTHPVVAGIADFTTTAAYVNYTNLPGDATNAVSLAQVAVTTNCDTADQDAYDVVVAGELGAGRMVFAGFMFQASIADYEIGDAREGASDQLLEQAVRWAAGNRDTDGDTVLNDVDTCPFLDDADQTDTDEDGIGNPCEDDDDDDGVVDEEDNCPLVANDDQADADDNGVGDACEPSGVGGAGGAAASSSSSSGATTTTSTTSGAGGGGEGGGGEGSAADDGCGCATVGGPTSSRGWALGLGLAALAAFSRRRRA